MSNKNVEKNTYPTNNYRKWLIGILIGLAIILIAWLILGHLQSKRNTEAEKFNASHFNSNVVIYDVPVGKLTVKKATSKINKNAKNTAILEGDKVVLKKTSDKVITNKQVQSYFESQQTRYPSRKKWNFKNETLLKARDKLNQIKDRQVKYTVNGKNFVFKRAEVFSNVSYENDKYVFSDTKILEDKINNINKEVATLHKSYDFQLPNGQTTKVKNESYGWAHKNLETPTGVWYIQYKESPSVLKGTNDDGSKYAVDVKYWMPFTLTGCGFHDNSWRKNWSKTAYLNDGSYGCVNLKPSDAPKVWNNIEKNEAVIIYK